MRRRRADAELDFKAWCGRTDGPTREWKGLFSKEEWREAAPRESLRRREFAPPWPATRIYTHANKPERTAKHSGSALPEGRT